ncbi:hypothetical protein Tco_0833217 [Tanacetum coccineum]
MLCWNEAKHVPLHLETQKVAARDEKWVPSTERVNISFTNIRLETTVPQKEETIQVLIDIIRNFTCFKAFTISADVLEIFMTILDICPRVEGVDFTDVLDDDTALTFLIDLGYKGPLNRENVDYLELIWEDFAYQIDHMKEKRSRHDGIIPPKKSRCKGSKGKKTAEESQETVDVSEESEPEPKPAKKKTSIERRVKKKVTLYADDNIISNYPNAALELAKSICQTETKEAKATRKVHATHARIMTESVPKSAKKKSSGRNVETKSDKDEIYTYKIRVAKDKDVEMKDVEVEESDKGEEKVTDAVKEEPENTSEVKDDTKKSKLPLSSLSLSISSGFGDQFLKLSSNSSLVSTVKDSSDIDVSSLLDIPIQQETRQTQPPSI